MRQVLISSKVVRIQWREKLLRGMEEVSQTW